MKIYYIKWCVSGMDMKIFQIYLRWVSLPLNQYVSVCERFISYADLSQAETQHTDGRWIGTAFRFKWKHEASVLRSWFVFCTDSGSPAPFPLFVCMEMCCWIERQRRSGQKLWPSRSTHVGESEHKRALPSHLVTRPDRTVSGSCCWPSR